MYYCDNTVPDSFDAHRLVLTAKISTDRTPPSFPRKREPRLCGNDGKLRLLFEIAGYSGKAAIVNTADDFFGLVIRGALGHERR